MNRFPEVSARIASIFREFYRKEASDKLTHLSEEMELFVSSLSLDPDRITASIEKHILKQIIFSYFLDVIKYKEYHFNPRVKPGEDPLEPLSKLFTTAVHRQHEDRTRDKILNRPKAAAFTAKWILRYMPIAISVKEGIDLTVDENWNMTHANEMFAFDHGLALMGRDTTLLQRETIDDVLYHFKYRPTDDRSLILAFSILSRSQH